MSKLLSIVIPTLNRYEYLKRTMDFVLPQVEKHLEEVELLVCCNASKDQTDAYMKELCKEKTYIRYKYFDEYVEVGQSLIRSVGEAQGEYVVLWGDDDIPYPCFCETILDIISKHPGIGVIHCNRLFGKDTKYGMRQLTVNRNVFETGIEIMSLPAFIDRFNIDLGFISSVIFRKKGWDEAITNYSTSHYGYEHVAIMLNGAKNRDCAYCAFPIELQRNPQNRDFSTKWPLYQFVGIPNMLTDFDKNGLSENSFETWNKEYNSSFPKFVWNMMYTVSDRKFYKQHCKDLNRYQLSSIRKFLTYLIVYCCPEFLFNMIKKRLYR